MKPPPGPSVATPSAVYVPFVQTGKLVFLSGHTAKRNGKPWVGQLGRDMTTEEGQAATRAVAIDLLGALIGQVFADQGAHARSAFGVAQIPHGACVEIELIAELK